jgi:integrase
MSKKRNPNGQGSYKDLPDGRVQWSQQINGEIRYLTAKTLKELQLKVKAVADIPIIKEKYAVDSWFTEWLETYIKPPLKKDGTYNQYESLYKVHIKPVLGNRFMQKVSTKDIQSVISKMARKGRATSTMGQTRNVMRLAFQKALAEHVIAVNPVNKDIEIPNKQAKERKTLTVSEMSKLFKAMENSRWIWSIRFLLVTGLRRGELLALKWADIDVINKQITVDKSDSVTGLGDTKSGKVHYVPLSSKAVEYLKGQKNMLQKEHNQNFELVFPNNESNMLKPGAYYTMVRRFAERAEIYATPHCLRHTFVFFTNKNLSLRELQNVLGHSKSTQTLDLYGTMISEDNDNKITAIDSSFKNFDLQLEAIEKEKSQTHKVLTFKRKG